MKRKSENSKLTGLRFSGMNEKRMDGELKKAYEMICKLKLWFSLQTIFTRFIGIVRHMMRFGLNFFLYHLKN